MRRLPPDRHVECLARTGWTSCRSASSTTSTHATTRPAPSGRGSRTSSLLLRLCLRRPRPPPTRGSRWRRNPCVRRARGGARETRAPRRAASARARPRSSLATARRGAKTTTEGKSGTLARERTRAARSRRRHRSLRDAFLLVRGFRERVSRTETSRQRVPWHSSARALRRGGDGGGRFVFHVTTRIRRVTFFGGRSATRTRRRSVSRTRRASFFSRVRRLAHVRRRDRVAALGAGADARERRRASAKRHRGGRRLPRGTGRGDRRRGRSRPAPR